MAGIDVGTLVATIRLVNTVSPALTQVNRDVQETGDRFEELEQQVDTLGQKIKLFAESVAAGAADRLEQIGQSADRLSTRLTLASAAATASAVGFAHVATQLNEVVAATAALLPAGTASEINRQTAEMTSGIQDLAIAYGKSTDDIGQGLYEVVSALGLTGDSYGQLETATKAAIAGNSSTIESFKALVNVAQVYGDTSAAAFTKIGDLSFQAVNLGRTTFPELSASIGGVAPIAKEMGVSMEEMFAIIETLAGVTGNTSEVVTQMASALAGLASPTDDVIKVYKKMGVETGAAAIAQKGLTGTLQEVAKASKETGVSVKDMLGRKEAWLITSALAGTMADRFKLATQHMKEASKAGGAILALSFDRVANGVNKVGFAYEQMKQKLVVVAQIIGNLVLPIFGVMIMVINKGLDIFIGFLKLLEKIPNVVRGAIVMVAGLVLGLQALLFIVSTSSIVILKLASVLWTLVSGGAAIKILNVAIGGLGYVLGQLGMQTAALKVGQIALTSGMSLGWKGVTATLAQVPKAFDLIGKGAGTALAKVSGAAISTATSAVSKIPSILGTVMSGIGKVISVATTHTSKLGLGFVGLSLTMGLVAKAGWAMGTALGSSLLAAGDKVRGVNDATRDAVAKVGLLKGAWILLGDVFKGIPGQVNALYHQLFGGIADWIDSIAIKLNNTWVGAFDAVAKKASELGDLFYDWALQQYGIEEINKKIVNSMYEQDAAGKRTVLTMSAWQAKMKEIHDEIQKVDAALRKTSEAAKWTDSAIVAKLTEQREAAVKENAGKALGLDKPLGDLALSEHVLAVSTVEATRAQERQAKVVFALSGGIAGAARKALEAADQSARQAQIQEQLRAAAGPGQAGYIAKEIEAQKKLKAALAETASQIASNVLAWKGLASASVTAALPASLEALGDASRVTEDQLAGLAEQIGVARASGQSFSAAATKVADDVVARWLRFSKATEELEKLTEAMEAAEDRVKTMNVAFGIGPDIPGMQDMMSLQQSFGMMAQRQGGDMKALGDKTILTFMKAVRDASENAAPAAKEIGDGLITSIFGDLTSSGKITAAADIVTKYLDEIGDKTKDGMADAATTGTEFFKQLQGHGEEAKQLFVENTDEAEKLIMSLAPLSPELAKAVAQLIKARLQLEGIKKIDWAGVFSGASEFFSSLSASAGDAADRISQSLSRISKTIQDVQAAGGMGTSKGKGMAVAGALSAAGSLFSPTSKLGGALSGAGAGAAIGTMIAPGIGTAIGGVVGAIGGLIGASKKAKEEMKQLKEQFLQSVGGLKQLEATAKEAGISLDKMFKAKNAKDLEKAIVGIQEKLQNWNEANAALQEAIDKYGFTIEELGPKFKQQRLDEMAGELLQDYKLLTASGIDVNTVIQKMSPNMNEYIQTALKAGAQIPIAMKPVIDAMILNGTLLDENGNAYASAEAAGITYAQTMSDMFTSLIERIDTLVNALLGIPDRTVNVNTVYTDTFRNRPNPDNPDGDSENTDNATHRTSPDYEAATGFHAIVRRPTRLLVGEAGPERVDVTPRGEQAPGGGSSVTFNSSFHIDPLQSNAARGDLGKFLVKQFFREARNNPLMKKVLREGQRG